MADIGNVIRPTDEGARRLARRLMRTARFAAIAVKEAESEVPFVSRVACATDIDGSPMILISTLSAHTRGLIEYPVCSLMFGEPGKGDPLAHPRVTVIGRAERLERGSEEEERARARYLARQPKAKLYADFGDFALYRIGVERASLNGGFGKAFELSREDIVVPDERLAGFAEMEAGAVEHMNEDHADAIALYAKAFGKAEKAVGWIITGLDPDGFDLMAGDEVLRIDFDPSLSSAAEVRPRLVEMAKAARAAG
ncbi:HugZ family protein [Rhizobiales bacterium]|uniref:HugZ family pyridoxamine 5'-phosphate oxidase n=1 Tax=Hongsoonwoonella zoysiae TaxID=2821844 RepID=UPI001560AA48|nr:DUF2470 domain-containing protein [Hongsoonwoonella zoysiae]NRG17812.1 HugZ family protein [Hongsoonwoonella zoysiae]